jgi:pimeloyl-ACP methyl ester carboxylesterase
MTHPGDVGTGEGSSDSDVPLYVESHGSGPPVVFAHGFGGSARNFHGQARALEQDHQSVLFDARGHARSGAPPEATAYQPACFVQDVGRVLDGAQAERAVLAGLSMGAGVMMRYALAHPERVRALVLAAPPRGSDERVAWASAFADAIERRGIESAGADFVWGKSSRFDAKAAGFIRKGFLEHSPNGLIHTLRQLLSAQPPIEALAPGLGKLALPVLVVVGADDADARAAARVLTDHVRNLRLELVEGAGHVVNLAAPNAFNAALREFLSELPR